MVTLKHRLTAYAPGLTPRAVLEKLGSIQMLDVILPTTDGRCLVMPRQPSRNPISRFCSNTSSSPCPHNLLRASANRQVISARHRKCSADLRHGTAENDGLNRSSSPQVRK